MKNRSIAWVVVFLTAWCVTGCSTAPKKVQYNAAEHENAHGTAVITFPTFFLLVDIDGVPVPDPAKGTRWNALQLPAGREINVRMYVVYHEDKPGYRRRGVFKCPPLEAGKTYKLWYSRRTSTNDSSYSGAGRLILTYDNALSSTGNTYDIPDEKYHIYVQEIPPL